MAGVGKMSKAVQVVMLVTLVLIDSASWASAVTCADVATNIQPCAGALTGLVGIPSPACCGGLQAIQAMEASLGLPGTCNCTRASLSSMPGAVVITVDVSTNVMTTCQVSLGFSLIPTLPC